MEKEDRFSCGECWSGKECETGIGKLSGTADISSPDGGHTTVPNSPGAKQGDRDGEPAESAVADLEFYRCKGYVCTGLRQENIIKPCIINI